MKNTILILMMAFSFCFSYGQKNAFSDFFSKVPPPTSLEMPEDDQDIIKHKVRPSIVIPALKILQATDPSREVDALMLTSTGGGISYQRLKWDKEEKKYVSTFSWSPLTVLLTGNLSANDPIDLSLAMTFGFFNNLLMLGGGYDLGSVQNDRSRIFGAISIGVNLNN